MNDFRSRFGPWALVTGASSGIGAEFAMQLAKRGLNVLLVGRRKQPLETTAHEIQQRSGISVRTIQVDLTTSDAIDVVDRSTRDVEIGLLVNNAGSGLPGAFLEHDANAEMGIVQLNAVVPLRLTHLYANQMVRRGHGGIIFVASTMGYVGMPYAANYSATKAYLIALGEALSHELSRGGISVLVVSPGPTKTPAINELPKIDFGQVPLKWMDAEKVVQTALRSLGQQTSVIPGEVNNAVYFLVKHVFSRDAASSFFGKILERMIR